MFRQILTIMLVAILVSMMDTKILAQEKNDRLTPAISQMRVSKTAVEESGGEDDSFRQPGLLRLVVIDFSSDVERLGLTKIQDKADLEKKLHQAGVQLTDRRLTDAVYVKGERVNNYLPILLLTVNSLRPDADHNIFLIKFELVQDVVTLRDKSSKLSATT